LCLWQSSVDLPNCGILLGHEEDRGTEKEEGECVGRVKVSNYVEAAYGQHWQSQSSSSGLIGVVSSSIASGLQSKRAPDGLFWFH
jgi:hypothetical protein